MKLQKLGGFASIILALVNIAYYILDRYFMFTAVDKGSGNEAAMMIAAYRTASVAFNLFYVLWIMGSITYLLIACALQERMQAKAPHWMRLAVIAASVTSALNLTAMISGFLRYRLLAGTGDLSAYRSALKMFDFMTLTSTHTWGWALLLIGCAALMTRALPRILSYIILVDGIAELITFVFFGTGFGLPLWYADMVKGGETDGIFRGQLSAGIPLRSFDFPRPSGSREKSGCGNRPEKPKSFQVMINPRHSRDSRPS